MYFSHHDNRDYRDSSQVIIIGHFNHPEIDWEAMTTIKGMNHSSQLLLDAIRDAYLKQHIDELTRYRHGQTPHILDLLLTSEDNSIHNIEYQAGMGVSDHVVIISKIQVRPQAKKNEEPRYRYHKGNYQAINDNLSAVNWDSALNSISSDQAWTLF